MSAVSFYFQVHHPYKLRRYTVFDLGQNSIYEDDDKNCDAMLHMARTCYLPMNDVLLRLIRKHGQSMRVAFSISGLTLEQFEQYAPEVLDSFKALADTGCVEFLGETYCHSITFLYAPDEFARQVKLQSQKIKDLFGQKPTTYKHTELIYNNDMALAVEKLGFKAMLADGSEHVLGWRSPNFVYQSELGQKLKVLMRHSSLSNDIAIRFSQQNWDAWPLTADTFAAWCDEAAKAGAGTSDQEGSINLFMPYETFGLRHSAETGIFQFMEALPDALMEKGFTFKTPQELTQAAKPVGSVDVPYFMSWAASGHDLDVWLGNDMQKDAIRSLYALSKMKPELYGEEVCRTWQRLQASDHFAYMCTKWFTTLDNYLIRSPHTSPFDNPYDAYINYMNVLADFELCLKNMPVPTVRRKRAVSTDEGSAPKKKPAAKSTSQKEDAVTEKARAPRRKKTVTEKTETTTLTTKELSSMPSVQESVDGVIPVTAKAPTRPRRTRTTAT